MRPASHQTYFIELTNHCNMHCTFCPSDELIKARLLAGEDIVEKGIRQIAEVGAASSVVNFNVLGEPLLNKKIFDYIALCQQLGLRCAVVTNLTLLTEKTIEKLLAFNNLNLVLSVQTPTAESYKIRGYKHMSFDDYMDVIDRVVLAKFRTRSQTWIEVHVADNNEQETLYRESGKPLWSIYADAAEQQAVVDGLIARCLNVAEQARAQYPDAYAAAVRPDPALVSEDHGPIQANPNIREEEFWGWMFAPNVYFRIKSFGLWALQPNFLAKFLEPTEKAFVEEHQGAFACSMAQNTFAMLADGQFTPCCLDYDGEIDFGNIGEKTVSQAFWSIERTALLADSSVHPSCRRCKGRAYIFDTAPPAADRGRVEMYGRGWHGFEPGLSGRGGRWSDGNGHFYLYGRAPVARLSLDLFSTFPAGTELRLKVSRADDSLQSFAPVGEHAFTAEPHATSTIELPLDLPAGAFYRFELITPIFRPSDVQKESRDHRRLGVAVFTIEAAFDLNTADTNAPELEAATA